MGVPFVFSGSAALFDQAKRALQTIEDSAAAEREHNQREAIAAIVFSAMTLEAFINEIGDLATSEMARGPDNPPSIATMGHVVGEVEEGRGTVQLKYQMAKLVLSGNTYDKGRQPYQDFRMLIDLRNALAHIKRLDIFEVSPAGIDPLTQPPKVIGQLRSRGLLADVSGVRQPVSWIEELESLVTARWACTAATEMIHSLIEAIPHSPFHAHWQGVYQRYYDLVEPPVPR